MINKEKIREYIIKQISRCKQHYENPVDQEDKDDAWSRMDELQYIKDYIDSIPEETSKDLEEAAEEYAYTNWESDDYHEGASEGLPFDPIGHTEKTFIAGANWQKEQDINKACEWLENDLYECIVNEKIVVSGSASTVKEFISNFKKAMEDEK